MARKRNMDASHKPIEQYDHKDKDRLNNPPVGLVDAHTDNGGQKRKTYQYDPHLDPQLQWAGKAEHTSFEVPTVSLHVHERIDPRRIIKTVQTEDNRPRQLSLFEGHKKPLREAVEFYKHKENWSNRLVAGDSLLVMNSLLEKEGMGGKVQMVYFDPPYGIKYGSNFQPFVNKRDVKDGKDEDLTSEPETIKAFRDTWELGIHSYLTYLRDRLLLARELLHESGSVFVQISDENVHLVRNLMDEVFGIENFVSLITIQKTSAQTTDLLPPVSDYLIWYSKEVCKVKYRRLFEEKEPGDDPDYTGIEFPNGERKTLKIEEAVKQYKDGKGKLYRYDQVTSQTGSETSRFEFELDGKTYKPAGSRGWSTSYEGLKRLEKLKRIIGKGTAIAYIRFHDDYPVLPIKNIWVDVAFSSRSEEKLYVVQTSIKAIQRCLLMTTDPGDLVLDITCGSGTTASVAENWGRRWITCDTSRVAITLAKQRLMTASFDYYELAHPNEGVGSGFKYKTVPHITLKSIANNEPPGQETLYDQPFIDGKRLRVTGPFTVEAVPAPVARSFEEFNASPLPPSDGDISPAGGGGPQGSGVEFTADTSVSRSGETLRQSNWRDELLRAGVRAKGGKLIAFTRVEAARGLRYVQAEAETKEDKPKNVYVVFGPEHAPLEQRTVELAWEEAKPYKPDILLFCALQFDEEAAKDIDEMNPEITKTLFLKAQMNADLLTEDLKKKRSSNESFWLIGQPDVAVSSFEFLVLSSERRLSEYETFKKLSGLDSLAEINGLGEQDIQYYAILSQGRDVWRYLSDEKGWDFSTGKYSRRTGKKQQRGIPPVSWNSTRFISGIRNFDTDLSEFGIHSTEQCRRIIGQLRRDSQIIGSLKEIINELGLPSTKNSKLTTKNLSQVEVLGFDYYNPKTGTVDSGGKGDIAVWMLDHDYDGRSLFPSQVFFPMAGDKEGWTTLAKNLKAEIDEEKIETFRGTVSLPFIPGRVVAVKIIDARGIESLKIMRL